MKINRLKLTDKQLKSLYYYVSSRVPINPELDQIHSKLFKLFWDRQEEQFTNWPLAFEFAFRFVIIEV